jgi:hypothetical protein
LVRQAEFRLVSPAGIDHDRAAEFSGEEEVDPEVVSDYFGWGLPSSQREANSRFEEELHGNFARAACEIGSSAGARRWQRSGKRRRTLELWLQTWALWIGSFYLAKLD